MRDKTWRLFQKVDWLSITGLSAEQARLALYSGACAAANLLSRANDNGAYIKRHHLVEWHGNNSAPCGTFHKFRGIG
jgi:hypothetical protein